MATEPTVWILSRGRKGDLDQMLALAKAMILASRALHDDVEVFKKVVRSHVSVKLSEAELQLMWQREHSSVSPMKA